MCWVVVVPVKQTAQAKTRFGGTDARVRRELAHAFALDTVQALADTATVGAVVVVTDDVSVRSQLPDDGSVIAIADVGAGLNAAVRHGVQWARERSIAGPVAVVPSDLPAATAANIEICLRRAELVSLGVLPDAESLGSTVLTAAAGVELRPAFGPASLRDHAAGGAQVLEATGLDGLRRDVDTLAHLRAALALGVGSHTREVVERLGLR